MAHSINMHTLNALKMGETQQRIFLLNAWRETNLFTEEEKVVLAITEEITLIGKNGLSDKTYEEAKSLFRRKLHCTNYYGRSNHKGMEQNCNKYQQ
ncbi:carboxymuconolactone decarboxylase family protein [Sphingobacterium bovisgrunnientis]|uniref:carboxymuconolactone decarboxylase family protein n=1 Tax=Sphingobacterium bovisgrunnientis TaxID=1874697 RepID=UPI001956CCB4|nr:hypothetical protein [Sphingobacterium bovisgrunnientis]